MVRCRFFLDEAFRQLILNAQVIWFSWHDQCRPLDDHYSNMVEQQAAEHNGSDKLIKYAHRQKKNNKNLL